MSQQQNFQPQVGDTTNGPHIHTYIPRSDGAIVIGGVPYFPENQTVVAAPAVTVIPVTIAPAPAAAPAAAAQPVPTVPVAATPIVTHQNYEVPYGGPAIPVGYPTYSGLHSPVHFQSPYYFPYYNFYQASASLAYPQPRISPNPANIPPQMPATSQHASPMMYTYPQPIQVQAQYPMQGTPIYSHVQQPPFNYHGLTSGEMLQAQLGTAQGQKMTKKMDMKPADDDPLAWYWCREQDGTWVQRNRVTIDSGDIGPIRWYADNGEFYAVRLPN